jgi:signal transduction histidine kinase
VTSAKRSGGRRGLSQARQGAASAPTAWGLIAFYVGVVTPTVALVSLALLLEPPELDVDKWAKLIALVLIVALVELIPVPMWRGTHIAMGFPLLMVVAFLFAPAVAAAAAFVAASDPRELRREVGFLHAVFNRSQVALAVGAASLTFHALATEVEEANPFALLGAAGVAAVADYVVNASLVTFGASFLYRMPPLRVVRELRVGRLSEFVISYLFLAVFGVILAKILIVPDIAFWTLPVLVIPLLLARQMFFRSKALEEAHKELQDREHVLRALSNRMAEERQDERMQIASYLHDDLAQLLFRLSIQVDVARRHVSSGRIDEVEKQLGEIKDTKNRTSDRIRALIRDLHRSPLGRAGLAEALRSFIAEVSGDNSDVRFHAADIDEVELPAPIALLMYHIGREAIMNSLKHAHANNMWITVRQHGDEVEMLLRDDGAGFDVDAPEPEGHFGLTMMRERATVGGGTFEMSSAPGEGATIKVRFPTLWLQPDAPQAPGAPPQDQPPAPSRDGAAPDTVSAPSGSTESVPA